MINRGFTLIETLIAVMILSTAIAGPLTIASRGLTAALVAKNQVTAYYLAQDGMEYIRFARDTNTLAGGDWITGLDGGSVLVGVNLSPCTGANGCEVDTTGNNPKAVPTACTSSTCTTLKYDTTNQRFTYGTGNTTIFARKITMTQITANEYRVVVAVSWNDIAGVTHPPVTIQESIFNWQ